MSRFRGGWGARPENALKRAEELENVGQKAAALQSLRDVITSKRSRANWSKTHEDIMFKLMDLCVEMKRRNDAKEALMQYRNMCQAVNINSLEEVIKHFLNKATEKAEEARQQAEATSLDALEDLDEDAKPEDLMMSYITGDKTKDRTDRELVTPWFRFLWESHRSVLEILRTNPKLEALYAMAAGRAFGFCLTYKRNAEFRRLCDILRQHLANMQKYRDSRDITAPESWALHLETRFEQLRAACELEMWGEAFRSVEDIQGLIALGKRQPKQQMMAAYYSRLTQIFKVSGAQLYHAYAWLKLFSFSRSFNKGLSGADVGVMATSVVLAALAVPAYDRAQFGRQDELAQEQEKERAFKMANILGFAVDKRTDAKSVLSRAGLLSSISAMNLLSLVPPEVKAAYSLMTEEFAPLDMETRLEPLLAQIGAIQSPMSPAAPLKDLNMADYVPALRNAAVVRMVKQLSDVYSTMRIEELSKLIPGMSFNEAEAQLVDAVKYGYLSMRVDRRNGTLSFGGQQLESERVRGHLASLAERLAAAAAMIAPAPPARAEEARRAALALCRRHIEEEHTRLLARKVLIEKRKELQEQALLEAEREEERKRQQAAREAEILEEKRRREEAARREKERIERELEEQEQAEARALLEQQAAKKKKGGVALKEGEKIDKASLMKDVVAERLKEQADLERKLQRLAKNMDHLERARREEEAPLVEAHYRQRLADDAKLHEEQQRAAAEAHRAAWEGDVVEKRRVERMRGDADAFASAIMSRRQEEFDELRRAAERRAAARREERRAEREIARRKEFVRRARAAVQAKLEELEEEQRRVEEEQRRAEEERREAEREEQRRKNEEVARKVREREEEIERKLREEKEAALRGERAAPPPAATAAKPGGGGGGYVPPGMRRGGDGGGGGGGGGGWRDSRPAPAAAAAAAPPPAREGGDRWGGPPRGAERPAPPAAAADRPAPPAAAAERPAPAAGGGGGRFVPSALRNREGAAAAPAPARPAGEERPREERPSGGYRPPGARSGGW